MRAINKIRIFSGRAILYFLLLINLFFLALLACSYLIWNISPLEITNLAYLGLGFIFILVACLLFTIMWLVSRKWIFGTINLVVILCCYAPISSYVPINLFKAETPDNSIKILSYNVRGFNWVIDKAWEDSPTFQYIKKSGADIVCIQEYLSSNNPKHATTEKLRKALGYEYAVITPLRKPSGSNYGLACFSKYPIVYVDKIPIESSDNGSVLYKIDVDGKIITVINNHLESNRLTSKDKALYSSFFKDPGKESLDKVKSNIFDNLGKAFMKRAPQAELITDMVRSHDTDAVIVCGDFNDTPMSYTYGCFRSVLKDAFVENGSGLGITYHENNFLFRIDYIFYSENLESTNFVVDHVKFSDHYPISTYLSFKD